jgi:branched-chain amino acid transport system ATP-binding protein
MLLSVENLHVSYDNIKALHGVSFRIDEGEIVCIIGANGAGKSSALRAISRLVPVEAGTKMTFMGRNLLEYPADKVVSELGISHVPEGRRLFDNLTVLENLRLATFARRDGRAIGEDLDRVFSIFPRLSERQDQKAGTLSGGEQQMLAVGMALMTRPKALILDEPTAGLSPVAAKSVLERLLVVNERFATTIILVEQNVLAALDVVERAIVLRSGQIVFDGRSGDLRRKEDLWSWF